MEIRYIWVEEFRNLLVNLDVNFQHQGKHRFSYQNKRIELIENAKAVLDFGPNIKSITAIAGKNGSGKSSLCELIIHAAATYMNGGLSYYYPFKGIVCYGNHIFYASELKVLNQKELREKGYEVTEFVDTPLEDIKFEDKLEFHKSSFIYYNNSLDWKVDVYLNNLTNISTQFLIGRDYITGTYIAPDQNDKTRHPDLFGTYYDGEGYRSTKFYLEYGDKIPTAHPEKFILRNSYSGNNKYIKIKDEYNSISTLEINLLNNVIPYPHPKGEGDFPIEKERAKIVLLQLYRLNLFNVIDRKEAEFPTYKEITDFVYDGVISGNLFSDIPQVRALTELYEGIVDRSEMQKSYKTYDLRDSWRNGYQLMLIEYLFLPNNPDNRTALKRFLYAEEKFVTQDAYYSKRITNYALAPLQSSGEKSYFSLFSRLYDAIQMYDKGYDERKDIVLFIDEGEGGFHPNWKKKFLNWVIDFLNSEFNNYKFQIIITTHSPYVLSDLSSEHIILLDLKEGKTVIVPKERFQPFGANIHELLADAFFLTDGQIGEYAKGKIQQVIDYLNNWRRIKEQNSLQWSSDISKESRESTKKIIGLIGDGIVRKKLFEMYSELFQEEEFIETEIDLLQSRLEDLRKRRRK